MPLGRVLDEKRFAEEVKGLDRLVTIGDYCTMQALEATARPKVAAVDLKIERRANRSVMGYRFSEEAEVLKVKNQPAHISSAVWGALENAFEGHGSVLIRVEGEEDLVTLPAIALAPHGFTVVYGLPDKGAVLVKVDEESKSRVEDILTRMEVVNGG